MGGFDKLNFESIALISSVSLANFLSIALCSLDFWDFLLAATYLGAGLDWLEGVNLGL